MATKTLPPSFLSSSMTGKQLGMLVALASFAMLFGSLFLGYFLMRAKLATWPPIGIEIPSWRLPFVSTLIMALSSLTLHKAYLEYADVNMAKFSRFWNLTLVMGFVFVGFQSLVLYFMAQSNFRWDSHLPGSIFYSLIAVHALHMVLALAGLIYVFVRALRKKITLEGIQLFGWFWHFLGCVWGLIFMSLYVF